MSEEKVSSITDMPAIANAAHAQALADLATERQRAGIRDYVCGLCGEEFGSNCSPGSIECTYCDARLCPCCGAWFSEEDETGPAAQEPHAADGLREALAAKLSGWRDHAVDMAGGTRDEMTEGYAVGECAKELAEILDEHPEPQPAPGDVLWVTPGDGTPIGGLLAHVGVEPPAADGDADTTGAHADGVRLSDYLREKGNDYAADMIERAERAAIAAREPQPAPGGSHIGRSWDGHGIEDDCPCPKAPCGLVVQETAAETCDEHPLSACRTIRQSHRADECPAITPQPAPELAEQVRVARETAADNIALRELVREMLPVFAHTAGGNYSALVPGDVYGNWCERSRLSS
jgi:hypothetical protein